jgi:hypothetical protein
LLTKWEQIKRWLSGKPTENLDGPSVPRLPSPTNNLATATAVPVAYPLSDTGEEDRNYVFLEPLRLANSEDNID